MTTRELSPPEETGLIPWDEIVALYPDQYVCLVDIEREEPTSPVIARGRVVGHGLTSDAAFEPIRHLEERYPRFGIRYTGVRRGLILHPRLVVDEATLDILNEPLKLDAETFKRLTS